MDNTNKWRRRRKQMPREFALYKGEEILGIGTIKEIAKELNVLPSTIQFYGTNTYKKRLSKRKNVRNARVLIEIEDD